MQQYSTKKILSLFLNYLPGAVVLCVSLFALNASLVLIQENEMVRSLYEPFLETNLSLKHEFERYENAIETQNTLLYWSIWILGLSGFVLVLMNANKLQRLSVANLEKQASVELLELKIQETKQAQDEKVELQDQLHQAQKLEAVGRLAGGIAHDFNNILAAMNGYAEFLIDDLEAKTQQHTFASNILKAGQQARDLVDKVLAFSRREGDEMRHVNLKEPIEETVAMLKASLPKTIELKTDLLEKDVFITGNQNALAQAMMNLCVNAKDAMENERGTLLVSLQKPSIQKIKELGLLKSMLKAIPAENELPLIQIEDVKPNHTRLTLGHLNDDNEYVCLTIADDGCGMSRVIMAHIFEPFFTTKDVNKGTGLGMAMVHNVMASHSGAMAVNSIIGKGTRFDLLFPVSKNKPKALKKSEPIPNNYKLSGRVLIVDDQDNVSDMLQSMITRFGLEAETCDSAQTALELLNEHPDYFDVIITDQNMPKMTGLELVQQAGALYPDLPFVVATGYALEKMEAMIRDHSSVKAVLKKPVDRVKLQEALQTIIIDAKFSS